jgi:hypothetical protein
MLAVTAQWFYMLQRVSAELFSRHQGDFFSRHKQRVTCHRMVHIYTYIAVVTTDI